MASISRHTDLFIYIYTYSTYPDTIVAAIKSWQGEKGATNSVSASIRRDGIISFRQPFQPAPLFESFLRDNRPLRVFISSSPFEIVDAYTLRIYIYTYIYRYMKDSFRTTNREPDIALTIIISLEVPLESNTRQQCILDSRLLLSLLIRVVGESKARESPANGMRRSRGEGGAQRRAYVPPPYYSHYSVHVRVYVRASGAAVRIEERRGFGRYGVNNVDKHLAHDSTPRRALYLSDFGNAFALEQIFLCSLTVGN